MADIPDAPPDDLADTTPPIGGFDEAFDLLLPVTPAVDGRGSTHVAHMLGNEDAFVDIGVSRATGAPYGRDRFLCHPQKDRRDPSRPKAKRGIYMRAPLPKRATANLVADKRSGQRRRRPQETTQEELPWMATTRGCSWPRRWS